MNFAAMPSLAGWLLSVALHGGLLLAAAWLIDRTVRFAPSTRESMWRCALFGGVFTASLQALMPTSPQAWHLALSTSHNCWHCLAAELTVPALLLISILR